MANHIEFEDFLTPERIEWAHRTSWEAQHQGRQGVADAGWRAALARDPKLLKALERGAEAIYQMSERQMGQTRRATSARKTTDWVEHTEFTLWKEAYRLCDEGKPIRNFEWIYGAAALLCGYTT